MSNYKVMDVNDDLAIRTSGPVHSGKVRSVYRLTAADSRRLIEEKGYNIAADTPLAIMIISDRISAFECIWKGENGLNGVPGKGAALNAISAHWFNCFNDAGLAGNHIVDVPHPYIWIVRQAQPVMVEAIARNYITGSMWRAYSKGTRDFCGIALDEGLTANQKLPELLITPSTKGIITGISEVPEVDDVNISRDNIINNLEAFKFNSIADVDLYEKLLTEGFNLITEQLAEVEQIFVDTKFEFGYVKDLQGNDELIYIDEVGTPDSSRIWDEKAYQQGEIVENSKEGFRQMLLKSVPNPELLLAKDKMPERLAMAAGIKLSEAQILAVSETYTNIAEKITGKKVQVPADPKAEILEILDRDYALIEK
ncbi:MAG: phosphoribosylaminoimidazolesuccinocarboxamide synthase [Oceanospirillaceae bacterium]|nr:phosphoribosylaminoimidazolesuccinocarboxamide synthase [Oceanospirillaceae bacterium]